MPGRDIILALRSFLGINRRDGADLVANEEFYTLQNWYQKVRGLMYKRSGTTADTNLASIINADGISAFHRQIGILGDAYTLYYCTNVNNPIANPTTGPTLTDIVAADGDLFSGGAVTDLTYRYSWVGCGDETGISSSTTITLSNTAHYARVTVPAFPTGVVAANVFQLDIGSGHYMICGTITSSAGHIDLKAYMGPAAAASDAHGFTINGVSSSGGSLKRGRYFIGLSWYTIDGASVKTADGSGDYFVDITTDNSSFDIQDVLVGAASTNGATWAHVFLGLQNGNKAPLIYVGDVKCKAAADPKTSLNTLTVLSIPEQINFTTHPATTSAPALECNHFVNPINVTGTHVISSAFIVKKKSDGSFVQIFWPRLDSNRQYGTHYDIISPFTGAAYSPTSYSGGGGTVGIRGRSLSNVAGLPLYLPITFASYLGCAMIANGFNLLLMCDGYTVSEIREKAGTIQPGFPVQVINFKNQLVVSVRRTNVGGSGATLDPGTASQVYGSNSLDYTNWASGGTGTGLRFATVGDPFGDGVSALGIMSFTSATTGPSSLILAFKKHSAYVYSGVPDQTSSIPVSMDVLSARVGCMSPMSIANTPIGTIFVGHDGDIYLIAGVGEPRRIGTKVKPLLDPVVSLTTVGGDNDYFLRHMSACYHDNHYKLSYAADTTQTGNNAQLWADLRIEQNLPIAWSGPHTGIGVGQQIIFNADSDTGLRYALQANKQKILFLDDPSTFQDLGVTISSKMTWKTSRFGNDMNLKRFLSMLFDLYYDSSFTHSILVEGFAGDNYGSANLSLSTGAGTWNSTNWDAGLWGSAEFFPVDAWFSPTNLIGRTFQWSLTHANNAQMIVAEADIAYQPERRRIVS